MKLSLMTHAEMARLFGAQAEPPCRGELLGLGSQHVVIHRRRPPGFRLAREFVSYCPKCDRVLFTRPDEAAGRFASLPSTSCSRVKPRRPR